jgi:hypothetical protein
MEESMIQTPFTQIFNNIADGEDEAPPLPPWRRLLWAHNGWGLVWFFVGLAVVSVGAQKWGMPWTF